MELKKGYKDSDVGVIPEDWQLKTMKDICWVNQGLQIPIEKRLNQPNGSSPVYITIQYLNEGKLVEYINDYNSSVFCNKEDILMTRTGNTGMVISNVEGVFHNNFFKINYDKKKIEKEFLICYLKSPRTQKDILTKAGTSTIPDLNHKDFYSILIPVPTLLEQNIIASTLSDADAYITSLEKLIEKKRQIKEGVIQELLKPKVGWKLKQIGEICNFQNGTALESYFNNEDGYNVISIGNYTEEGIFKDTQNYISVDNKDDVKKFILKRGELAFLMNDKTAIGTIIGRVLLISEDDKFVFNQRTMRLSPNIKFINPEFLFYLINSKSCHERFVKLAKPGTQIYLNTQDVLGFELSIPCSIDEQKKIISIISEMDKNILLLSKKLEKMKLIKQGMMQNLLTGKIRLI
jgi:type I restriction enzyme S subunit